MISLISLVALSPCFADMTRLPAWQTDYQAALEKAVRQHKPLAVFLAPSKESWHKLSPNGMFGKEVHKLLATKYVPVFLNTQTVQGKAMASAFELPEGIGLVLSDREGQYQAFRHEGMLAEQQLAAALERHADSAGAVRTTEILVPAVHEASSPMTRVSSASYAPANGFMDVYVPTCLH